MDAVTEEIKLPNNGKPVSSIWDREIGILGSGSDFTGFIQHIGMVFEFLSLSLSSLFSHLLPCL